MDHAKKVVTKFFESMSDLEVWQTVLSEDATWWLAGDLPLSGLYCGKDQILNDYIANVDKFIKTRSTWINKIYSDGNTVIVEAQTEAVTRQDRSYHNFYAFIFEVCGDKVTSVREYLDTESSRGVFE